MKLTPVLRPSKTNAEGTAPIYLRIAHKDKTRYISLGLRVKPDDWNRSARQVRKTHPEHYDLNETIGGMLQQARSAGREVRKRERWNATAEQIKAGIEADLYGAPEKEDYIVYCEKKIAELQQQGQISYAEKIEYALRKLKIYHRKERGLSEDAEVSISFDAVTTAYLRGFASYCLGHLAKNTVSGYVGGLQAVWSRAVDEMVVSHEPFRAVTVGVERKQKQPLTMEEIEQLDKHAGEEGHPRRDVWNMWKFAVYAMGMRFSDVALLTWENVQGDRLRYVMRKNEKHVDVKLPEPAKEILAKYEGEGRIFPILEGEKMRNADEVYRAINRKNSLANMHLRKIAGAAGLSKTLTFHVARDTFANLARKHGRDLRWIQTALRHSSLATTERYLSTVGSGELDEGMDDIFG